MSFFSKNRLSAPVVKLSAFRTTCTARPSLTIAIHVYTLDDRHAIQVGPAAGCLKKFAAFFKHLTAVFQFIFIWELRPIWRGMVEGASSFTSEPITGYRPKQAEHLITHPPRIAPRCAARLSCRRAASTSPGASRAIQRIFGIRDHPLTAHYHGNVVAASEARQRSAAGR